MLCFAPMVKVGSRMTLVEEKKPFIHLSRSTEGLANRHRHLLEVNTPP